MGIKEILGINPLIIDEIESLDIPDKEKEMMYEFLYIEKQNRDREHYAYAEQYQSTLRKYMQEISEAKKSEKKPEPKIESKKGDIKKKEAKESKGKLKSNKSVQKRRKQR